MAAHATETTRRNRRSHCLLAVLAISVSVAACTSDDNNPTTTIRPEPSAGAWRAWVIGDPATLEVPAPPTEGTAKAKEDLAAVKTASQNRSQEVRDEVAKWDQPLPSKPWTDLLLEIIAKGAKNPPLASRNSALVHVAMYDAVIATWYWKYHYDVEPPSGVKAMVPAGADPSYPSEHAAIAGAASRVIQYLYPNESKERLDQLADAAGLSRVNAGVNTPSDVAAGLDLGRKVADAVIAYGKADGSDKKWDGKRPPGITDTRNFWQPVEGQVSQPVEPLAGTWKPWALSSGSQFRPGPPPAYGTPEFRKQVDEVLFARNNLTPEQEQAVKFYAGSEGTTLPAGIVADVSQSDVIKAIVGDLGGIHLSVPRAVRAMALVTVALADAGIAAWDTKFTYWNPRPEQAIKNLGADPNFKPVIDTSRFPAYISGSSTYAGAGQAVMSYLFPQNAEMFKTRAETQAESRVWAGIHWRLDFQTGLDVGRKVGGVVVERAKTDGADS